MLIRFLGTKFLNPEARVGETTYPMTRNKRGHWLINVEDPKDSGLFLAMAETWRQYNEAEETARDEEAKRAREAEAEADDEEDDEDDEGAGEGDRDTIETLKAQQAKLEEAAAAQVAKDKARKAAAKAKKETGAKGVRVPATKTATDTKKATPKPDAKEDDGKDGDKPKEGAKGLGMSFLPPDDADKSE